MYNDQEIEGAIATGAIDRETADRLRSAIAEQRSADPADDEQFRLVTSFNDIFVTIASGLVLFAAASLFHSLGGLVAAAASWALAEHFTRRKRMALPSIFLLVTYAVGVFSFLASLVQRATDGFGPGEPGIGFFLGMAAAGGITAGAVALHWRRFHVPITVAAGAISLAVTCASVFGLMLALVGVESETALRLLQWFAFAIGVAMFAYAMRWDMQDPERVTRRSDVAFWLHLAASPLIVHPLFLEIAKVGVGGSPSAQLASAGLALLLYGALGVLALVVDRRAVLVSALVYVVIAIAVIMRGGGDAGGSIAVSGAVIGGLLLAMSVFWRDLRHALLRNLPERMRIRLPEAAKAGN